MGGKNNFFNQAANTLGLATGLSENKAYQEDPYLKGVAGDVTKMQGNIATGVTDPLAAMQYNNFLNQAMASQNQAAASSRGLNPALAFNQASQNAANMQAQGAGQAALLAEQERRNAQQLILQMQQQRRQQALQGQELQQQKLSQTIGAAGSMIMAGV